MRRAPSARHRGRATARGGKCGVCMAAGGPAEMARNLSLACVTKIARAGDFKVKTYHSALPICPYKCLQSSPIAYHRAINDINLNVGALRALKHLEKYSARICEVRPAT